MVESIKSISVKEFREKGYLQEVNRQFFHPLGLALSVEVDTETEEERFGAIWDYRDDEEGIVFDESLIDDEFVDRAINIERLQSILIQIRFSRLGFVVQPYMVQEA